MKAGDYIAVFDKVIGDLNSRASRWSEESDQGGSDYRHGLACGRAFAYGDAVWTIRNELRLAEERAKAK